jgi:hypothetical protein
VKDALVVPSAALLDAKGDEAKVLVVDEKSLANSRDVKTGIQSGQQVQIVSGLKPGEVVVTEGAFGLPDKTKVKIEKAESSSADEGGEKDKDDEAAPKTKDDKAKPSPAKDKSDAVDAPKTKDDKTKAKSRDNAVKDKKDKD